MTNGAVHEGMAVDKIAGLCELSPLDLSPAEQSILAVARGAADNPNSVSAKKFDALKEHFDDTQIVEIVAIISLMGFFNRWNDTMAIRLEQPSIDTVTHVLPAGVWSLGKHE